MTNPKVKLLNVQGFARPENPYSHVAIVTAPDRLVITSGQLGVDISPGGTGRLVHGFAVQVRQALSNLRAVLASVGMGVEDIMSLRHYIVGPQDHAILNAERQVFLGEARPASVLVHVSGLAHPDALYEVEATAAR
jgi:enamine deaminase RidA (YjgF/YER057c/UK114 family)